MYVGSPTRSRGDGGPLAPALGVAERDAEDHTVIVIEIVIAIMIILIVTIIIIIMIMIMITASSPLLFLGGMASTEQGGCVPRRSSDGGLRSRNCGRLGNFPVLPSASPLTPLGVP